jgi:hypothetical protein
LSIAVKIKIQVELLLVHSLCYQLDVLWMSRNFWHNKFYNFFCIFWYASYLFWLERKETKKQRNKERKKERKANQMQAGYHRKRPSPCKLLLI